MKIQNLINNYLIDAKELLKVFQNKIPQEFLNDHLYKPYNTIKRNFIGDIKTINNLIRTSEVIILYTRAESLITGARLYLSSLCCFNHKEEEEKLSLYMPSYWIIKQIYRQILYKKIKKNNLHEEIFNKIINKNFPIIPKERLKLRIEKILKEENEKTLLDYINDDYYVSNYVKSN